MHISLERGTLHTCRHAGLRQLCDQRPHVSRVSFNRRVALPPPSSLPEGGRPRLRVNCRYARQAALVLLHNENDEPEEKRVKDVLNRKAAQTPFVLGQYRLQNKFVPPTKPYV